MNIILFVLNRWEVFFLFCFVLVTLKYLAFKDESLVVAFIENPQYFNETWSLLMQIPI